MLHLQFAVVAWLPACKIGLNWIEFWLLIEALDEQSAIEIKILSLNTTGASNYINKIYKEDFFAEKNWNRKNIYGNWDLFSS